MIKLRIISAIINSSLIMVTHLIPCPCSFVACKGSSGHTLGHVLVDKFLAYLLQELVGSEGKTSSINDSLITLFGILFDSVRVFLR